MSNNVLKMSKQQSQPHSSGHPNMNPFSNSVLQLQRNISLDNPKEKDFSGNLKDLHPQATSSQQNIKKLAVLLDPHKELNNCVNSSYTSPKSFVGNSTKSTNLKASASSLENSNLNLISPKDLVRLAMSKHKSKAALVKKVPVQTSTSMPRNMRKSVCLRSGESRSKKRDRSNSKAACTTLCDEPSMLSKTTLPMHQEKTSKMKRMKLIYNDTSNSELTRLARSTIYTPQEASGRVWQGTLSPNRSNSGLLWPGSPNPNISVASVTNAKSKGYTNQIGLGIYDRLAYGKENEESKAEDSHRKRGSVGHVSGLFKESKKQAKKSEKKTVQPRQTASTDNLKASSLLYSKLLSQNAAQQESVERAKSPTVQLLEEDEIDENQDVLEISEYIKDKETKPREEFIADLKNWVNDIVKPQDEIPVAIPKKSAVAEKVKEVQEGLLAKLRDALDNDEYVRREDYERLYTEKESIEEELDATKEENAQLRAVLWKIQEEKENEEAEKKQIPPQDSQDYESTIHALQELVARQNMELEDLKRREYIVKDVLQMIWRAGSQIGGLQTSNMMNLMNDSSQNQSQPKGFEQEHNSYVGENGNYVSSIKPESYVGDMPGQQDAASDASSRNPLALSEMEDSGFEVFNIQPLLTMAKSPHIQMNPIQKVQQGNPTKAINSNPNPEISGLPVVYQNYFPAKSQEKLKLDLAGLGGNISRPKSNMFSTQSSIPNINKPVMIDTAQPMGFHEEFMSKLEEFSLSWRQDALKNQKF